MKKLLKFLALCVVLAVSASVVAGCGSSDSGSKSSTGEQASGGAADAAAKAKANLAKLTNNPPEIDIPPLSKAAPTGVSVTYATCPISTCADVEKGTKAAAKVLGWNVKTVNQGLTPPTVQAAWNGIAQNPGDAVFAIGILPNSAITKQLEKVAAADVPYIGEANPDPVSELMLANLTASEKVAQDGERMANWVIADANGEPGEVIYVNDPNLVGLASGQKAFHETMKEVSPESTATDLKVSIADAGTKLPGQLVNMLRTHPDAKYVVFNHGDFTTGVAQALKGANLQSDPKLVTRATNTKNMEEIKSGAMAAGLTEEFTESGWRAVDLIARELNGQELYSRTPLPQATFLTKENVPADISHPYEIPNYQEQFKKAWGK